MSGLFAFMTMKDTPFNKLHETMHLACIVLDDGSDIPKLVWNNLLACTINGPTITIDTLRNIISKLLSGTNKVMNNQLLLSLQIVWIDQVIVKGNIDDKANEDNIGYSFLLNTCNEFHCHGQDPVIHLFSGQHTQSLFIKKISNN
jgi:hypothetical protein